MLAPTRNRRTGLVFIVACCALAIVPTGGPAAADDEGDAAAPVSEVLSEDANEADVPVPPAADVQTPEDQPEAPAAAPSDEAPEPSAAPADAASTPASAPPSRWLIIGVPLAAAAGLMGLYWLILRSGAV